MKRVLLVILIGGAVGLGLAVAAGAGRNRPPGTWPKDFEVGYCWGHASWDPLCPTEILPLQANGTWALPGGTGHWFTTGGGLTFTITIDANPTQYDGNLQLDGCYLGTMTSGVPGGPEGHWRGCYLP